MELLLSFLISMVHVINKIILTTAEVSVLAGAANSPGSANGFGTNAQFYYSSTA